MKNILRYEVDLNYEFDSIHCFIRLEHRSKIRYNDLRKNFGLQTGLISTVFNRKIFYPMGSKSWNAIIIEHGLYMYARQDNSAEHLKINGKPIQIVKWAL